MRVKIPEKALEPLTRPSPLTNALIFSILTRLFFIFKRVYSLANSPQARKRARQATGRRAQNMSQRSEVRTSIKRFKSSLDDADTTVAQTAYREVTSQIDRAARKGLAHPNQASRLKSRLNARLKAKATATA